VGSEDEGYFTVKAALETHWGVRKDKIEVSVIGGLVDDEDDTSEAVSSGVFRAINEFAAEAGVEAGVDNAVQLVNCVTLAANTASVGGRGVPVLTGLRLHLASGVCEAWAGGEGREAIAVTHSALGDIPGPGEPARKCAGLSAHEKEEKERGCRVILRHTSESAPCVLQTPRYVVTCQDWYRSVAALPPSQNSLLLQFFSTSGWCEEPEFAKTMKKQFEWLVEHCGEEVGGDYELVEGRWVARVNTK
jgi:hypothetical protein